MSQEDKPLIEKIFTYVVGYVCGIVCLFGIIGNVLTLIVLTRPTMRASNSNLYLIVLAVYDTVYLTLTFFLSSLDWIIYEIDPKSLFALEFTVPAATVIDPIIEVSVAGSVYTTVALTIDRCIAVSRPLHWPALCTRFRIKVVLVLVFLWSVLTTGPFFGEMKLVELTLKSLNKTFTLSERTTYSYSHFHTVVFLKYIFPATTMAIPILLILVCNIIIVIKVAGRRKSIASTQNAVERSKESNRLTGQVLFISLLTLISRGFHASTYILTTTEGVIYITKCSLGCAIVSAVTSFVVTINSAINFICYCYFGKKFRTMFFATFPCLNCSFKARNLLYTQRIYTLPSTNTNSSPIRKISNAASTQTIALSDSDLGLKYTKYVHGSETAKTPLDRNFQANAN